MRRHGLDGGDVLGRIQELRRGDAVWPRPSPETAGQRDNAVMGRTMTPVGVAILVAVAISASACGKKPQTGSGEGTAERVGAGKGSKAAAGAGISLSSPVECPAGTGCVVRNFVDTESGHEARDFKCGRLTYDGHDGTDISVPDGEVLVKGVPVLAAADGVVLRVRDGMADASIHGKDKSTLEGKDAGNSVVIDHGGGWETQYSHLRKGSVVVRPGDVVEAGSRLGLIGLSGFTEFMHVHFEVRHHGKAVDPYTGLDAGGGCEAGGEPLWAGGALEALAYASEAVMDAGFATSKRPDPWEARAGAWAGVAHAPYCEAFVFWADVVGPRPGDVIEMRLIGPDGSVISEHSEVVSDASVSQFRFLGKKTPPAGWPGGKYRGEFALIRTSVSTTHAVLDFFREISIVPAAE